MKLANSKSIRATLQNLANKEKLDFQSVVIRYLHERLLYRLSVSEYVDKFILKGGNLLYAIEGLHTRPTMDIDMLAKHIGNEQEVIKTIFQTICNIQYEDDCASFDTGSMIVSDIAEEKKYSGVRLLINARLDTVSQRLQIDIGFGDIVTPAPVTIIYPVLLEELNKPEIKAYSIETVIAEKFQAMIHLGSFNSRMKDFYDIYILLNNNDLKNEQLQEAIIQTFRQRDTIFMENHELFSESFYNNKNRQIMWKAFLKKIKHSEILSFETVMQSIVSRLYPIYERLSNK